MKNWEIVCLSIFTALIGISIGIIVISARTSDKISPQDIHIISPQEVSNGLYLEKGDYYIVYGTNVTFTASFSGWAHGKVVVNFEPFISNPGINPPPTYFDFGNIR